MIGVSDGQQFNDEFEAQIGPITREAMNNPPMLHSKDLPVQITSPGVTMQGQGLSYPITPNSARQNEPANDKWDPGRRGEIDHEHHVPLVATALTKDGENMYGMAVDHRVPLEMEFNGSKHDITPFLYAHESAELPVMHDLVKGGMDAKSAYGLAHDRVANPTEAASRFAYAAKNGLDPEEFNKAYYNHIKAATEIARQPTDREKHPEGHTTIYGLDSTE